MGYTDLGCYGGEINTPNLDSLAGSGLRLSQFYNTGRCCPTRGSLLTGLYPHQSGVGMMLNNRVSPGYQGDLSQNAVTIAEALKGHGYQNFMSGKWHVTSSARPKNESGKYNWPLQRGFDKFYGTIDGAGSFWDPSSLTRGNSFITPDNDPEYQPETYFYTDAITDNAIRFIEKRNSTKPFFLYLTYTAAHWPLHAHPRDIAKYKGFYDKGYDAIRRARFKKAKELGVIDEHTPWTETIGDWDKVEHKEWEIKCMEVYAAMVDNMDQNIGKLVDSLKKEDVYNNTLIFYMQDNGGCQETFGRKTKKLKPKRAPYGKNEFQEKIVPAHARSGEPVRMGPKAMPGPADTYVAYGENWANVSNTPFRMYKHYVHEGGISTPLIAHWPAGIKNTGRIAKSPAHLIDIMATCVDVSNANFPKTYKGKSIKAMEGTSLVPLFEGQSLEPRTLMFEHQGNRAIRINDWKLVAKGRHNQDDVKWELYDLSKDRSETNDLSLKQPERVKEMKRLWNSEAERVLIKPWPQKGQGKKNKKKIKRK